MYSFIVRDNLCYIVVVVLDPWECLYPSFYIRGERGYKEDNRVGYNMISISNLSLLNYFIDISIDIIIYVLRSTSWSSKVFYMVGRVVADSSLGLSNPRGVVPQVPILISYQLRNSESAY
jgi:hypothetical protein